MARTPPPVAGALQLREWALALLSSPDAPAPPPDVPAAAWECFFRIEQCALATSGRAGLALAGEAAAIVNEHARAESRMVLSARAQMRRLSALARACGARVVVLKGGVALLRGGGGPRLMDVDLLASPADAAALVERLDAAGYRAHGRAAAHRLEVRAAEHDVPLEIHTAVPGLPGEAVWERLRPAPDGSALFILHPADHLHYLLLHSVVQHADRRGRLRDLLLAAEALDHCTPEDVRDVSAALAADRHAEVLAAQLRMADAIRSRTGTRDRFELTAAGAYLMAGWLKRHPLQGTVRELAWQAVTAAVARRAGTPALLGEHGLDLPSAVPALAGLRRVAPGAERALRTAVRRSREWALLPLGLSIATAAERAVRERSARPQQPSRG